MVNYSEDGAAHVFQLENFFVEKTCKFKLSTIQFFSKMTKYSPGNIISAECPLVHILNDDKKSQFCDNCLLKRLSQLNLLQLKLTLAFSTVKT